MLASAAGAYLITFTAFTAIVVSCIDVHRRKAVASVVDDIHKLRSGATRVFDSSTVHLLQLIMGSSSSSPTRSAYDPNLSVSKPSPLRRQVSANHLHSTHVSHSRLSAPSQGHRRTRSARVANVTPSAHSTSNVARERPTSYVSPPPPYSVAVTTPPENVGSSHTNVYMASPSTVASNNVSQAAGVASSSGSTTNNRINRSNTCQSVWCLANRVVEHCHSSSFPQIFEHQCAEKQ
jgi:hypothetical protein